jgi:Alginate export
MKRKRDHRRTVRFSLGALAWVPLAAGSVFAQPKPFMQAGTAQPPLVLPPPLPPTTAASEATSAGTNAVAAPEPGPIDSFFNHEVWNAIAKGTLDLSVRLRYEQVDEEGVPSITKNSYAPTIRTRFGYTTAPLYGFQGMLEGVNVTVLGPEHNYNAAGSNAQGDRPVVADPPLTRLNQAWLGYSYTNRISTRVGEQRIVLDNQRFIGDSDWRQNMQTFDAAEVASEPITNLDLYYAYVWDVHRVFGNVSGLPPANTDFESRSHLINVSYTPCPYARLVGYSYLLDLRNAAGNAFSSASYGGYLAGEALLTDRVAVEYRAEFAWETGYADSPLHYRTEYYNLELGASIAPVAFGAGYEVLGSGVNTGAAGGRASFQTPLATLHQFNGWDDVFLTTPVDGLRDLYGYAQVTLPIQIPIRLVYHKYYADFGGGDYGQEFDIVAVRKLGKHWAALLKYAYYQGQDVAAPSLTVPNVDIQKFWAQMEFNF